MFSSIWGCIYILYICLFYYSAAYLVRGLRRSLSLTVEATTPNTNIWMLLMKGDRAWKFDFGTCENTPLLNPSNTKKECFIWYNMHTPRTLKREARSQLDFLRYVGAICIMSSLGFHKNGIKSWDFLMFDWSHRKQQVPGVCTRLYVGGWGGP